ncbi:hypothetical protein TD95_005202 [Thielaviopsis punctulata]|uniref:SWR1-complex protein 4 n=1 Tax=Thielaviopsis punctulata TaxID=72032 RepID=A0A0F4ZI21_9PEZI|nr:hypothetical protein TD95_005202 [Thielaviopsis punctulata]
MAASDLRDVLDLPADGPVGPKPSKKAKTFGPRHHLKGLAREVQSLGGDTPIAIVQQQLAFKKKRFASRKPAAKWEMRQFTNSARQDSTLVLRHWKRKDTVALGPHGEELPPSQPEDSAFAKFNVHVQLPQYSDDQYRLHLKSADWTKEETDYLLELAADFDLRWPLIWDRYDYTPTAENSEPAKTRTMEDMKARYYEVAAKMMATQKPVQYMTQPEQALYETMATFSPEKEKARKEFVGNSLARSKEEAREEELLLVEIKRVLARNERFNEERRELYQRLDYPRADQHDISSLKTSAGLQNLLQNMMTADKTKKRKSIVGPGEVAGGGAAAGSSAAAAGSTAAAAAAATSAAGGGGSDGTAAAMGSTATASTPVQEHAANRRESVASSTATASAPTPAPPTSSTSGHHRRDSATVSASSAPTKKGAHPLQERKKLGDVEMAVYGVSHHDRLTSGASFRTERTNKLFASKSNQQQIRITNVLTELEVPPRLTMPTAAVSASFEKLLHNVNSLLDCRKVTDKLEAEIKLEMAKKAEREKAQAAAAAAEAEAEGEGEGEATTAAAASGADEGDGHGKNDVQVKQETERLGPASAAEKKGDDGSDENAAEDGEGEGGRGREERAEEAGEGNHKRSASVLSSVSDKSSSKRQKK